MACFHPLKAFRTAGGEIIFNPHRADTVADLTLPCGQCVGCRLERSRQWAIRCVHEASLHKHNCFLTLTFAPFSWVDCKKRLKGEHDPLFGQEAGEDLVYAEFQKFMKRLRKRTGVKVRYYMCGEYGENFGRAHFHACLFGFDFSDKRLFFISKHGDKVFRSELLEELWPWGISSIGEVTFKSAAYVARYIMKKVTGDSLDPDTGLPRKMHYYRGDGRFRTPEFTKMSLKPGIGSDWFDKYKSDVYPHDYVVINGKKVKPPRYYDKKYAMSDPFDFDELEFHRFSRSREKLHDNTPERLAVRKEVLEAKLSKLKRNLV